jgi:hypothetical protein
VLFHLVKSCLPMDWKLKLTWLSGSLKLSLRHGFVNITLPVNDTCRCLIYRVDCLRLNIWYNEQYRKDGKMVETVHVCAKSKCCFLAHYFFFWRYWFELNSC